MNMLKLWILTALITASASAQVFPLPPFTVYGEVEHWNGRAFSTNDEVTVIVKVDEVEMDRTDLAAGDYAGQNYRLHVPISSAPRTGYARPGDVMTFEVYFDGALHEVSSEAAQTVGDPATARHIDMYVGTDTDADGLPDEYEELLQPYYQQAGKPSGLADISPDDDFDGDGYSNYAEFLAGTAPVVAGDYLKISDFYPVGTNRMALAFLSAPGRSYTVPHTDHLESNNWSYAVFSTDTNLPPEKTFEFTETDQYTILYLLSTNRHSMIRLEVQ
jgi:hypothetical protein